MKNDYQCHECKHSIGEAWRFRCIHPKVMAKDSWSEVWPRGVECSFERSKKFGSPCGEIGTLWEERRCIMKTSGVNQNSCD